MSKPTILLADNDPDFLTTTTDFLKEEGFEVVTASNPTEARRKLEQGGIDLAVLDIRLTKDNDERDISGLLLAKEFAEQMPLVVTSNFLEQWVPTIMLTSYPTYENVREALAPMVGGLSPAVNFIAKAEGQEALLRAIKKVLEEKPAISPPSRVLGRLNTEQRLRPTIALLFLFGAVLSAVIAVVASDPRWLVGTTALGILYAIVAWVTVQ